MEKEFAPYQESLELKGLEFDEPCFGYYDIDSQELVNDKWMQHPNESTWTINAPTFSQAFRWFRKKYGIFTSIVPNKYGSLDSFIGWIYVPSNGTTKDINVGDRKGFSTPEEAELACLRKLIEIVKAK